MNNQGAPGSGMETNPKHWSRQKEQAAGYWHIKLLLVLFKIFPVILLRLLAFPVGFFYFLFSKRGRTESKRFLRKVAPFVGCPKTAKRCLSPLGPLRHIVSFSLTLVEKLQSWGGKFTHSGIHYQGDDVMGLIQDLESGRGVFIITSHLGNTELLRGLASIGRTGVSKKVPITAVVDTEVTGNFSRMIKELNPQSAFDLLSASEIGPQTAALLEEKLAAGGIITIAGDRTQAHDTGKNLLIPFLGEEAPFSPGIFYMTVLMEAPVYFVFALRQGDLSVKPEFDMFVHKNPLSPGTTRKERFERSSALATMFADLLEHYCKRQPFQWYNFHDFWSKGE